MVFRPPVEDIEFTLRHVAGIERLAGKPGFENYDGDLIAPILQEAGKIARDVIAPLNQSGDREGATLGDKGVSAASGFGDAYKAYREGGWVGLAVPEAHGGQGLPRALASAVLEIVHGANMAFGLCPLLSQGAIEALMAHGSDELQATYLPKLVSGEWTGTMNLTEPQAGSDVGALKTRAERNDDGSYAISGQKIYITWGDHDVAENIIHLVLARLPNAPAGNRGISLFLVPKFKLDTDGQPGEANGVACIGLEEKLGIHASPTCVMEYSNAKGWLIGEENRGLACMFTMMNAARLNVGFQGIAIAEAAYQEALAYALDRQQGYAPGSKQQVAIINHPDVRRTLLSMKSRTTAARGIAYCCAIAADLVDAADNDEARENARLREELLTPIVKAWSTDIGVDVASDAIQLHGGMGFMKDTLVSQLYRDARIAPIYEGTNAIQAMDLVGRKLTMANGKAMADMLKDISATVDSSRQSNDPVLVQIADRLDAAREALSDATDWMRATMSSAPADGLAGATAYLALAGDVIGGHVLARGAVAARATASSEADARLAMASFYAEDILSKAPSALGGICMGASSLNLASKSLFAPA